MNILIFGKYGQVGWELNRSLRPLGNIVILGEVDADFTQPEGLRDVIRTKRPDVIVNAAAYTAVDAAEQDEETAALINAESVKVIAEEALVCDALLIHYSTDYVFDGRATKPYTEDDVPSPINAYGRTKLAGEQAIRDVGCKHLIFRTSWVYASRGKNFMLTMLRLARERETLKVVGDQVGAPTSARFIADVTSLCLVHALDRISDGQFDSGLYNLTTGGSTSWHGFAEKIIASLKHTGGDSFIVRSIESILTKDYPTSARRPLYSCLDTSRLKRDYNVTITDWEVALALCLDEVGAHRGHPHE